MRHCAKIQKVSGSIPDVSFEVLIDLVLPAVLGDDSASNRNTPQEYFLGMMPADE